MGAIQGKKAKLDYAGNTKTESIRNWTVDIDVDMLDTTVQSTGTVQWRTFLDGLSGWTGTAEALFDAASTGLTDMRTNTLTPSTATVVFYLDKTGGENFSGGAFIESASYSAAVDGLVEASFDFRGDGALSYATAT